MLEVPVVHGVEHAVVQPGAGRADPGGKLFLPRMEAVPPEEGTDISMPGSHPTREAYSPRLLQGGRRRKKAPSRYRRTPTDAERAGIAAGPQVRQGSRAGEPLLPFRALARVGGSGLHGRDAIVCAAYAASAREKRSSAGRIAQR